MTLDEARDAMNAAFQAAEEAWAAYERAHDVFIDALEKQRAEEGS